MSIQELELTLLDRELTRGIVYKHSKEYRQKQKRISKMYRFNEIKKPIGLSEKMLSHRIDKLVNGQCAKIYVKDLRFKDFFAGYDYLVMC